MLSETHRRVIALLPASCEHAYRANATPDLSVYSVSLRPLR